MNDFDLSASWGQETVNHTAPNGTTEVAIRPAGFPGHPEIYSKKDIDKEKELAEIDFYNGKTKDGLDIVPIPKTYSTSPGINIHGLHSCRPLTLRRPTSKHRAPSSSSCFLSQRCRIEAGNNHLSRSLPGGQTVAGCTRAVTSTSLRALLSMPLATGWLLADLIRFIAQPLPWRLITDPFLRAMERSKAGPR